MRHERLSIEGRGPVAIALRLFLARQGFAGDSVQHDRFDSHIPEWLASRPLALSLGSWQLLSRIVELPAAASIRAVDVSLAGRAGRTLFQATDLASPLLGCVVRYGALHRALLDACARLREPVTDAACVAESSSPSAGSASVDDAGREDQAALVVVADGEPRAAPGRPHDWRVHDFDQSALLTEVVAQHEANGVAFERFTNEGPLALLPLPEPRRHAVVWCARPEQTARRAALGAPEFDAELLATFGRRLGALHVVAERHQAPLQRRLGVRDHDARRIAIGNAAQSLHPVAGQGLNLGLRDAFELAQQLGEARGLGHPLGDAVARFRRSRRLDRVATVGVTDTLARLFTLRGLAPMQSVALGVLDLAAPARNRFATALMFGLRSR